jgi:hypothetical protein
MGDFEPVVRRPAHDLRAVDLDGDGTPELLAVERLFPSTYSAETVIRCISADGQERWSHTVRGTLLTSGLLVIDTDGDQTNEVVLACHIRAGPAVLYAIDRAGVLLGRTALSTHLNHIVEVDVPNKPGVEVIALDRDGEVSCLAAGSHHLWNRLWLRSWH